MKICFIGGGNMASAMLGGLVRQGVSPQQLRVVEIDEANRKRLESQGFIVFPQQDPEAILGSDVIVLAVKPQQMKEVAERLGPKLSAGQIVLSIAAGIRLMDLARWLGSQNTRSLGFQNDGIVLVRAMPNTPALIGAGITGLYSIAPLKHGQRQQVEAVMKAAGASVWIRNEEEMDAVTAISGSGPAYFFYFIEALEQAGRELGLPQQTARTLALETALGAARLAHESSESPATLRERVTSKNGTTERALLSLQAGHVKEHIIAAAKAAAARSREMGDELGKA
ncbi:MAG TPA: pyrroline-5-carboxylate reductase [Gallionella sp.]|nr:pyrroline-5-carboxylate reductase [Gallionella sp.]